MFPGSTHAGFCFDLLQSEATGRDDQFRRTYFHCYNVGLKRLRATTTTTLLVRNMATARRALHFNCVE